MIGLKGAGIEVRRLTYEPLRKEGPIGKSSPSKRVA